MIYKKIILIFIYLAPVVLTAFMPYQGKFENTAQKTKNENQDTIRIFNGKDISNLHLVLADKDVNIDKMYKIKDGTLYFEGGYKGYVRTNEKYTDFTIHAEWMWPKKGEKGNGGILVYIQQPDTVWPNCIQINFKENNAGDLIAMNGAVFKEAVGKPKDNVVKLSAASEKPEGEWNTCDIKCKGDSLTVFINHILQNKATKIKNTSGSIGWQLEGKPIAMRNIYLIKK